MLSQDSMWTDHYMFKDMVVDQGIPIFLMGCVVLFITIMQTFFKKTLRSWGFTFGSTKINVDENLPPFFEALKYSHANWLVQEDKNLEDNYSFSIVDDKTTNTLRGLDIGKKTIQGVPYYMILSNPLYVRDFQYLPADLGADRADLVMDDDDDEGNDCEQSDMVTLLLNIAFIPEEVAARFSFKKGFNASIKGAWLAAKAAKGAMAGIGGLLGAKVAEAAEE